MRRPARSERKNAFQTEKALAEGAIPSDKGHASRGRMKSPFRHVCTNRPSSAQQTAAGFFVPLSKKCLASNLLSLFRLRYAVAAERFAFEKGKARGGGTASSGPK